MTKQLSIMKTFNDLNFQKHPIIPFGQHAEMEFKNGYGISVVNGRGAYSRTGTYEVAVLYNGDLCYNTDITDDVLGYQTPEQVTEVMRRIQEL